MPRFRYKAFDAEGQMSDGDVEALDERAALQALMVQGLTPVEVSRGAQDVPWWARDISLTGQTPALKAKEVERFFSTLSALIGARFPLTDSLRFCAGQTRDPRMRRVLARVRQSVENGSSLKAALDAETGVFPARLLTLVGIGEASNTLPETTEKIAALLMAEAALYRELRGTMVYPVILMVTAGVVFGVLVFYLVPTLVPVFNSARADIPLPLALMMALRGLVLEHWSVLLVGLAGAGALMVGLRHRLAPVVSALARRLPVIGPFLRQQATLEICRNLHLMLSSGATLPAALATARDAARGGENRLLMQQALSDVQSGGRLSDTLSRHGGFDAVAATLIQAGEQSDRLPDVLGRITEDLTHRSTRALKQLVQLLTPVMTLFIGGSIGVVILSTISAIMDLNDLAF